MKELGNRTVQEQGAAPEKRRCSKELPPGAQPAPTSHLSARGTSLVVLQPQGPEVSSPLPVGTHPVPSCRASHRGSLLPTGTHPVPPSRALHGGFLLPAIFSDTNRKKSVKEQNAK